MGVNSLPKIVTRQRRDRDLNPGPSVPESSTLRPILSVFPALIVHSELKSVHPGFPVAFIF